ncbi:MAG: response regulator transcription factor [Bdellovibrionales bacterium]|nr:response regulator transcription factor [Bdellovibrionales bacterium]
MGEKRHILLVEDDPDLSEIVSYNLGKNGYAVSQVSSGKRACEISREKTLDLVLLDLMLPDFGGLEVCQFLRMNEETRNLPILMITAKDEEEDVVEGLQAGADDYVTKPFRISELLARVEAFMRRANKDQSYRAPEMRVGDLHLNLDLLQVKKNGQDVSLTKTEFYILWTLATSRGKVFTRKQLLQKVHGPGVITVERNIDVHVASLRRKLKNEVDFIDTIRGVGYRSVPMES